MKIPILLILILLSQIVIIAFQLFRTERGILLSNRILGVLFIILGLQILISLLTVITVLAKPVFFLIDDILLLSIGPLVLVYSKVTLGLTRKFSSLDLVHFFPFFCLAGPFIFFLMATPEYSKWLLGAEFHDSVASFSQSKFQTIPFLIVAHLNSYLFLSFFYLSKTKQEDKNSVNAKWVRFTLLSFQLMVLATYVQIFMPFLPLSNYPSISFLLMLFTLLAFTLRVLLIGMDGKHIFSERASFKYEGSVLSATEKDELYDKLVELFIEKQAYLSADISIKELAEKLETHPKKVSQVINEKFGRTFFDFVNHYRIEYAKDLLKNFSSGTMTVAEVQYASGFNSKSSFHTQFKKNTGHSPSEFRRSMAN